jgi:hypothetical protein
MSSTVTDLPLHEVVLKIMFHENMEKAVPMKPEDVLWRIDNPEISERQVREVLDWLVRQKKAELYLGKYSIDRIEFLEQKELYEQTLKESENQQEKGSKKRSEKPTKTKNTLKITPKPAPKRSTFNKDTPQKRKTFYLNPPKVKRNKYHIYLLILGLLAFTYLSYTFLDLEHTFDSSKTLEQHPKTIINIIDKPKSLYVSKDDLYTESEKNAISNSFSRQNTINKATVKEFNRLQFKLDSITITSKQEALRLQTELQTSMKHSNTIIKKVMLGNFIIIILFSFLYFKFSKR